MVLIARLLVLFNVILADNFIQQRIKCYGGNTPDGTGCWIVPNECYTTDQTCLSAVNWVVDASTIQFSFLVYNFDLTKYLSTYGAYYVALGLSLDQKMGSDTVFVCVTNSMGNSTVYLGWNDGTHNYRLYRETELLLSNTAASVGDKITCQWSWNVEAYDQLSSDSQNKVFDLSDPDLEFYFLLARGPADPYTFDIKMHAISPGNLYPFMSTETTTFCNPSCNDRSYDWLTDFTQDNDMSQLTKQKMITTHVILMLILLFVVLPTSIMIARFGKDYLARCCHSFVWFQMHRILNTFGFVLFVVAIFLIFYQSDRNLFQCTLTCATDAYNQQLHTIMGTIMGSLVVCQIFGGYCRPSVSAVSRKAWNLLHTFTGYIIYIGFCVNALVGVQLQKISLTELYGRLPVYILIVGIGVTILVFICCEWIVHSEKFIARDPDRIERFYNPADDTMDEIPQQNVSKAPIILILFNLITGLMVALSLTIMVVKASRLRGFKL
ncbi:unnamed protein product [Bursaphelenchus okinawaensis]|uniref:Cytochrome b561 domain-containing protein n=1 Tax=Bursaphelenchus okinawaensis TaxID=465554 RepID=A0A811K6T4_9BILA|nr:unnamed protein product [Bursaphelenchus okinawaensis]CAG9092685.1 unnamed protein product [Bursaphelenchus okinawaensis]